MHRIMYLIFALSPRTRATIGDAFCVLGIFVTFYCAWVIICALG
jgi:hypothetical protein